MPGKGPELLPSEAANIISKASADQESLHSFRVRSSFWGEPMLCQMLSTEMDVQGEGIRPSGTRIYNRPCCQHQPGRGQGR